MTELECLGEQIAELAAHLDAATHRLLAAVRDFDARGGWYKQGAVSCAHWLAWRVGWDLVTARERVRVARKLAEFAAIDDALRRGELSYSKVRALLRIATPANEAMIIEHARLTTASQLEMLTRKYALVQRHGQERRPHEDEQRRYVRRRDTEDGMVKIEAVLHPEEAELVWTMLDHAAKQRSRASVAHSHSAGDSAESPSAGVAAVWQPATRDTSDTAGVASGNGWENSAGVRERLPGDSAESPGAGGTMVWQSAGLGVNDAALTGSNGWGNSAGAREPSVGDSAESCAAPPVDEARSGAAGAAEGAAELASDCSRSGRSLFDRLVDEVRDAEIERAEQAVRDAARAADGSALDSEPELGEKALASAGRRSGLASRAQPGMLQRRAAAASCAFDRADALVSVARAYLHGDQPQRAPIDVTITIPASSLRRDAVDTVDVGCMGSACISAETARRLSCDAGVVEVIEDEQGVPLSVGRKRRTIAGSIKRALLRRDGACTYPGCSNRMFLEGHHIEHWADGGATALDNAALMCSHHHRFVHEYGYTVELGPDRRPQFRDPHGGVVAPVPARHHGGDLGWPQILAANASLAIDADTIACEWDGKPVRYGRVIDDLVAADGLV